MLTLNEDDNVLIYVLMLHFNQKMNEGQLHDTWVRTTIAMRVHPSVSS